jgi:hypothetical protein
VQSDPCRVDKATYLGTSGPGYVSKIDGPGGDSVPAVQKKRTTITRSKTQGVYVLVRGFVLK